LIFGFEDGLVAGVDPGEVAGAVQYDLVQRAATHRGICEEIGEVGTSEDAAGLRVWASRGWKGAEVDLVSVVASCLAEAGVGNSRRDGWGAGRSIVIVEGWDRRRGVDERSIEVGLIKQRLTRPGGGLDDDCACGIDSKDRVSVGVAEVEDLEGVGECGRGEGGR